MSSVPSNRLSFLILATAFQGTIALLAGVLAWLLQLDPFRRFECTFPSLVLGIAGTIPMLLLFAFAWQSSLGAFGDIRRLLLEGLGPLLQECRWYDLVWVALLAGFSEELLFRAVLQTWMTQWGLVMALLLSNLLFGLAHAVTPFYVLLAALLGAYLGLLFQFAQGNLLAPTLTHALYDLVAFYVIRRAYLARSAVPADPAAG